jgi:hypothetical protein
MKKVISSIYKQARWFDAVAIAGIVALTCFVVKVYSPDEQARRLANTDWSHRQVLGKFTLDLKYFASAPPSVTNITEHTPVPAAVAQEVRETCSSLRKAIVAPPDQVPGGKVAAFAVQLVETSVTCKTLAELMMKPTFTYGQLREHALAQEEAFATAMDQYTGPFGLFDHAPTGAGPEFEYLDGPFPQLASAPSTVR